jgi:hypothetical protein
MSDLKKMTSCKAQRSIVSTCEPTPLTVGFDNFSNAKKHILESNQNIMNDSFLKNKDTFQELEDFCDELQTERIVPQVVYKKNALPSQKAQGHLKNKESLIKRNSDQVRFNKEN